MGETLTSSNGKEARRRARIVESAPVDRGPTSSDEDSCPSLQHDLAERLVILRAEFQEAISSYSVRVQGLLAQAGDLLVEESAPASEADQKRRSRLLRQALDNLAGVELKPAKGRRRDLKFIEKYAAALCDEIAEW